MKKITLILLYIFTIIGGIYAQDYYSRQSGPWDDLNTWSTTGHDGAAASK